MGMEFNSAVRFINNDLWTIALGQIHNLRVSNLPSNSPFGKPRQITHPQIVPDNACVCAVQAISWFKRATSDTAVHLDLIVKSFRFCSTQLFSVLSQFNIFVQMHDIFFTMHGLVATIQSRESHTNQHLLSSSSTRDSHDGQST